MERSEHIIKQRQSSILTNFTNVSAHTYTTADTYLLKLNSVEIITIKTTIDLNFFEDLPVYIHVNYIYMSSGSPPVQCCIANI